MNWQIYLWNSNTWVLKIILMLTSIFRCYYMMTSKCACGYSRGSQETYAYDRINSRQDNLMAISKYTLLIEINHQRNNFKFIYNKKLNWLSSTHQYTNYLTWQFLGFNDRIHIIGISKTLCKINTTHFSTGASSPRKQ